MANVVFSGPTRGYVLTQKDVEWLARSLWGEASTKEGKIAVAWTHINRFLLMNMAWHKNKWAFWQYLQGHSQPINPKWRRDGVFCKPGGSYYGKDACSEDKLIKRDKYQKTPYAQIPEVNRELAEAFAEGNIDTPFSEPTYDFAAKWLVEKKFPCTGFTIAGNSHLPYKCLRESDKKAVIPGEVTTRPSSKGIFTGAATVLVVVGLGYGISRILGG